MFESNNFIQNYHPMFEVFLDVNSKEVRLSIVDKFSGKEVWNRRRILLTGRHETLCDERKKENHTEKQMFMMSVLFFLAPSQVMEPLAHRAFAGLTSMYWMHNI